jgi:hypothetical protein
MKMGPTSRFGAPAFCRLIPSDSRTASEPRYLSHRLLLCSGGSTKPNAPRAGYLLIEALVYIAVVLALLAVGYAAMYRCVDRSLALHRNADDMVGALKAGERWRSDIRSATTPPQSESVGPVQLLHLQSADGPITYRFATNAITRRVGGGAWTRVLSRVKSSDMTADQRDRVTAWRWELELEPRRVASARPSRIRPLFTFLAVPETTTPK